MPNRYDFSPHYSSSGFNDSAPAKNKGLSLYSRTFMWLFVAFMVAAVGTTIVGPMVPPALMMPLYFVTLGVLLLSGLVKSLMFKGKETPVFDGVMTILVPLLMGIMLYPTLLYYAALNPAIITEALVGTVVLFGGLATWGMLSKKTIYGIGGILFGLTLAIIAVSLLNAFLFHSSVLGLIVSIAVLIVFSIYSYMDVQALRDGRYGNHGSVYALNLFIDIINLFTSLLRIISAVMR